MNATAGKILIEGNQALTARRSKRKPPVAALRRDEVAILQFLNDVL